MRSEHNQGGDINLTLTYARQIPPLHRCLNRWMKDQKEPSRDALEPLLPKNTYRKTMPERWIYINIWSSESLADQGSLILGSRMGTGPWPVRNRAAQQEVSSKQLSEASSLFTAAPYCPCPHGLWENSSMKLVPGAKKVGDCCCRPHLLLIT